MALYLDKMRALRMEMMMMNGCEMGVKVGMIVAIGVVAVKEDLDDTVETSDLESGWSKPTAALLYRA